MRILHVGPSTLSVLSARGGAVQRRMLALARAQAARGDRVVIASPGAVDRVVLRGGAEVHELALRRRRPVRDYEFLLRTRRAMRRSVAQHGPFDVVHVHGSPEGARFLAGLGGVTAHSVDYFRYRATAYRLGHRHYRASLARYDVTMPVSDFCALELDAFYPGLATRMVTVPNGVDLQQFRPDAAAAGAARTVLGLPARDRLVVYLGRICRQKGSDLLGDLAQALRAPDTEANRDADGDADVTVVAVGPAGQFGVEGPDDLIRSLTARGVVCTGAVGEGLVRGVLAMADVVVLPTRHDEMFGMAALEALACGTPVVASDLGGIAEAVGPGGLLFPAGDAAGLVAAVRAVLSDEGRSRRLSEAGREHARGLSWDLIADRTATAYGLGVRAGVPT